jgi:transposase InsO family protein
VNDTEQQFAFIHAYSKKYPVVQLVKITNVSKSGYYKWRGRGAVKHRDLIDERLIPYIMKIFKDNKGTYGRKRIKTALNNLYDLVVNEKRISRLMRKYGLICKIRRKYRSRNQPFGKVPNILNQNFKALKPGKKYAVDITYLEVKKGRQKWAYLCAIKDLFNGEIAAYSMGTSMELGLVFRALEQLKKVKFQKGAILHSDQGIQFTNLRYQEKLGKMGLTQSMSRRGNCWDNACIENFFGHLKVEMPFWTDPQTLQEVYDAANDYITYYNSERIQNKLKMSPIQFRENQDFLGEYAA